MERAKRTIVVSAVNIRKGGTLTILRGCLEYLSSLPCEEYRVVALVHKRSLADFRNIEYIEIPTTVKSWFRRLWCEYVTMYGISKKLQPVDLWLSLHDTTPRVVAKRQVVYCQTSFPFLKVKIEDLRFDPKIVLFSLFTRFAYQINVHRNKYLIVQAEWLRKGFSEMFRIPEKQFVVCPPEKKTTAYNNLNIDREVFTFLFVSTPDCHKNFETLCEAAKRLEKRLGNGTFRVVLTIKGDENKYSRNLFLKYGQVPSIRFEGFMSKDRLYSFYDRADCRSRSLRPPGSRCCCQTFRSLMRHQLDAARWLSSILKIRLILWRKWPGLPVVMGQYSGLFRKRPSNRRWHIPGKSFSGSF